MRLLKFYPWGESFPGSPYFGGGLSGAGFGITIAPDRRIWVGNFGFAGLGCPTPPADSVSVFKPDGTPLAPSPFTAGPISWPQATVADRRGNVWIANCAAASVALYPKGRPHRAFEIPVPGAELVKPFGLAIDHGGNAWVAGTISSSVAVFGPRGDLIEVIPSNGHLTRPMGVAADSRARRALLISGRGPTLRSRCSSATPIVSLMPTRRSAAAASPFPGGSPLTAPIPCGSPISAFPSTWAIPTTRWLGTSPIG
jgi:hypothetical protein